MIDLDLSYLTVVAWVCRSFEPCCFYSVGDEANVPVAG